MSIQQAILATLHYHALFAYPLGEKEIFDWLYRFVPASYRQYQQSLKALVRQKRVYVSDRWYFLTSDYKTAAGRFLGEKDAQQKTLRAKFLCRRLTFLPWIKLIALTGNTAMQNSRADDDIDLMIVTAPHRLWLTRLLIVLWLKAGGHYRLRSANRPVANRLCLNLWLESDHLTVGRQSAYTAHELLAVQPLVNKDQTYERLLTANSWAKKWWPNRYKLKAKSYQPQAGKKRQQTLLLSTALNVLNRFAGQLQRWYMRPKMTREKVTLYQAFFHPIDRSQKVLSEFQKRLK